MQLFFAEHFKAQLKRLIKKYPHAKEDLLKVIEHIDLDQEVAIGNDIYKVRIGNTDMRRGKSGGFRAYVYCYRKNNLLAPLCMYPKSTQESISDRELQYHVDRVTEELFLKFIPIQS